MFTGSLMSPVDLIVENPAETDQTAAEQLGAEITELCSYIYAAESRLLTLIREFDHSEMVCGGPDGLGHGCWEFVWLNNISVGAE